MSSLYISHDLGVISAVADEVMVLYAGQVVETAPRKSFYSSPAHPYSRALLEAMPTTRERKVLRGIAGIVPSLASRADIPGCYFAERCGLGTDECEASSPQLRQFGDTEVRCFHPGESQKALKTVAAARSSTDKVKPLLSVSHLSAGYNGHNVLHDISFTVAPGSCTALVGESGSGKSTLSRSLIGLHGSFEGEVLFKGSVVSPRIRSRPSWMHRDMQYVFQNPYASLHPRRTIGDSIAVALRNAFSEKIPSRRQAVMDALEQVALSPKNYDRFPSELSGGERQRAAIARALVCKPSLIICDEVTSALDVSVQASVLELLENLMLDDVALLFVTHDLGVVRTISDQVIVLKDGYIVEEGDTDRVIDAPQHAYTQSLLERVLELD